jgi:hypothetical protein
MDLFDLHFGDESFDVVMTSHALEPNGGREKEGIRELCRVARRYVLMLEPDYDLAPAEGKRRMERLGYVTQLWDALVDLNCDFNVHPFEQIGSPLNPTSLFLVRKGGNA